MIIIKKYIAILLILILFTSNTKVIHANPSVPAAVTASIASSAIAAGAAAALEGMRGIENAETIFEKSKVVYDSISSANKLAFETVITESIEAGNTIANLTSDALDFINNEFIPSLTGNLVSDYNFEFSEEELNSLGLVLQGTKIVSTNYKFVITYRGDTHISSGISLATFGGAKPPYYKLSIGNTEIARTTTKYQYEMYEDLVKAGRDYQNLSAFYSALMGIASTIGVSIGFQDAPIDNWGEEVERILRNTFEHAGTSGIALNLADVIATTLDGVNVRWDVPSRTWVNEKGIPLAPDIPVENVRTIPKTETGTENPPIEENPPFELDLSVPQTASINIQPLIGALGDIKNKFPFSIPWDLAEQLSVFNVEPQAPNFIIDFSSFPPAGKEKKLEINFEQFDAIATAARWFLTIAFDIAIILILRKLLSE